MIQTVFLLFFLSPSPNSKGSPPPRIQWYVGDRLLDDQMDEESQFQIGDGNTLLQGPASQTILANTLTLGPFKRSDLKKLVTCEVSNTNLTNPLSAAVMIDMNCKYSALPTLTKVAKSTVKLNKFSKQRYSLFLFQK